MIHTGEIDPAYLIFNVFQQRNRERMNYALKLLDTEPDWTRDESFDFDREHARLAGQPGGDGRAVASARQERCDLADADRQELDRDAPNCCASATSACCRAWTRSRRRTCSSR